MVKLTPTLLAEKHPEKPLRELVVANCKNSQIAHVDDISAALNLHKLDLSQNSLKKPDALSGLKHCKELTWLNLSQNQFEVCGEGLQTLANLLVLNLSHNAVNRISIHVSQCTNLKALILNHNKIQRIENIATLASLNTLVLSHNLLTSTDGLGAFPELTKLSIAHNQLRTFPDLRACPSLKELRLNNNKLLNVPDHIRYLPSLEILDIGHNLIRQTADIANLASLHNLINLNVIGNPFSEAKQSTETDATKNSFREDVLTLCPTLRILDGERFDPKFLERKSKRKALEAKKRKRSAIEAGASFPGDSGEGENERSKQQKVGGEERPRRLEMREKSRKPNKVTPPEERPRKLEMREKSRKPSKETLTEERSHRDKYTPKARSDGSQGQHVFKQGAQRVKGDYADRLPRKESLRAEASAGNQEEDDPFFLPDATPEVKLRPSAESDGKTSPKKTGSRAKDRAIVTSNNQKSNIGNQQPKSQSQAAKNNKQKQRPSTDKDKESQSKIASHSEEHKAPKKPVSPSPAVTIGATVAVGGEAQARSGVLAVVEIKPKAEKKKAVIAPFDPTAVAAGSAENGTSTAQWLVGGWD
ncbi:hypothetical protein HDU85_006295 [Gaertneriomyces sp. JEL0708]|nr:hypothetical protein HDU85_006295 [Gaertneriomyces sp. JEL0708]